MAAAMRAYMVMNHAGTLLAVLVAPAALSLAGITPVVLTCGVAYLTVGMLGLIRHAAWIEAARRLPA